MKSDLFSYDPLQLYMGCDYKINEKILIKQPTMKDVVDVGEQSYFSTVYTICANPTDMKVKLWDNGIDWCEIEDFELFTMLTQGLTQDRTKILFGDLDLSNMKLCRNRENGDVVLADIENEIIIDKLVYQRIVNYIRKMHNITPVVKRAKNKFTKEAMVEYDRNMESTNAAKEYKSYLVPIISALQCRMGWTKDYILSMGIVEFFEVLNRSQIINNADHLLSGVYAGTIDLKKTNKKELNWLRDA